MAKFEKVSRFADVDLAMPVRKTAHSAGYDFVVAEDIVLEPYASQINKLFPLFAPMPNFMTLDEMAKVSKETKGKPTLVSTGMKCKLEPGTYLELSVRSSTPLKYWIIMANSVGIIDADYYNNPDNEGEIFFQLINLSPVKIELKRGDIIGQGIIKQYLTTEDDMAAGERIGGFGSTNV
jgi:dUTP pyrophosphatase